MTAAITVEGLGKCYRVDHLNQRGGYRTLRESLGQGASSLWHRLRSNGVGRTTEEFWALRDVDFEVQPGEVVGIIGRNGAGKSTLLKILSRITKPTTGNVELRGRVGSLLEVGTGFHPELTGRENVFLNGSILGMNRREIARRFDEIVAFAEIDRFLDTPVKRYSSGMYVRLAFAVAAHLEPEILVVDEVLAVGDTAFQKKCLGKISEVTQQGRTVLFVSHNMASVHTLCTSSVLLESGRVSYRGGVGEGIDLYMCQAIPQKLLARRSFEPPCPDSPWMRSAALRSGGQDIDHIRLGDELKLIVEFAAPQPLRYPKLGFVISDDQGQALLNANNLYQPCEELESPCSEGVISCDLGIVPLMPGRYYVSLWFGDFAHNSHVEKDALAFEVVEHDAWGLGRTPPRSVSKLWWPTRFQISEACPSNVV
jgi:lipopolysaccharide transport system ATP-binding protein